MIMKSQETKVAVVSGAHGYLGKAIVEKLISEGFVVAGIYNSSSNESRATKSYKCDLRDEAQVRETLKVIERELGPINVSVNAAGIAPDRKPFHLSTQEDVDKQFEGNFFSGRNFLFASSEMMKKNGGVIVGITTAALLSPETSKNLGAYIPAKSALQSMLAVLRQELAASKIRVYAVAPGYMAGGMNRDIPQAFNEIIRAKSPTKKLTNPQEVAEAVSRLCLDETGTADFLTVIAPELGHPYAV